jgi:DNA-binding IclR family transcriptional regulator
MASKDELSRFIRSSFRSVWSLELLLLLKREPRTWTHEELVAALRASDLIVRQGLEALTAAGLVSLDAEGGAAYRPISTGVGQLVDETERLYARSPDAVRRLIVSASASGLAAFADAFRLRRD